MKRTFFYLLPLLLLAAACRKEDAGTPPVQTISTNLQAPAALSLTIAPAGAVKNVLLINQTTNDTLVSVPAAVTGGVQFSGLAAGSYTLHFNVNATYHLITDSAVMLKAGSVTVLGPIQCSTVTAFSKFSFSNNEGNGIYAYGVSATVNGANFTLAGSSTFNYRDGVGDDGETGTINIHLDELNGPGTYVCKGTAASCITMNLLRQALAPGGGTYSSTGTGGSATVVITAIDPVARTISGTFTAVLVPQSNGARGNQTIKNGIFQLSYQ